MSISIYETVVYSVITNSDLIEGRGRKVIIGYYEDDYTATQEAKGQGVMGTDATVAPMYDTKVVVDKDGNKFILGSKIVTKGAKQLIRDKALAKLTEEEKEALGLLD